MRADKGPDGVSLSDDDDNDNEKKKKQELVGKPLKAGAAKVEEGRKGKPEVNAQDKEDTERMLGRIERVERVRAGRRQARQGHLARLGRAHCSAQRARECGWTVRCRDLLQQALERLCGRGRWRCWRCRRCSHRGSCVGRL